MRKYFLKVIKKSKVKKFFGICIDTEINVMYYGNNNSPRPLLCMHTWGLSVFGGQNICLRILKQ